MTATNKADLIDVTLRVPRELIERAVADGRTNLTSSERLALAKIILEDRRKRRSLFPNVKFGEASWDMILELYLAHHANRRVDVSTLCAASGAPTTTAKRHIDRLVAQGYMIREADESDKRRTFLLAATKLCEALGSWLDLHVRALILS